nr:glycosyltransferase [Lentibacillus sp. JNUCC-1]
MYPSKHSKTFGIFVEKQVEALKTKGVQVDVIAIRDPRKGKTFLLKKYIMFALKGLWNLMIYGKGYDVVHVHYIFPTGLLGILHKRLWKTKLIVTSHGGDIDQMSKKGSVIKKYTKKILDNADHIITVGEELKSNMEEQFSLNENKISVINMGVNRHIFHHRNRYEARQSLELPKEEKVILYVGNIIKAKGLDELVQAYKGLSNVIENPSLHLIGEPKDAMYFNELKAKAAEEETIYFHNAMNQEEVSRWMAASDVFVLPSHIEGFGLVALEAMACGLPVVGSDVGGLHYLLGDGAGIKVEPNNPKDLAEKLHIVLEDQALQKKIQQNGLKKAEKYDHLTQTEKVLSLYKN